MKTIKITADFDYYPDGSEETKQSYKTGDAPSLPDDEADSFVTRGLAETPPVASPAPARAAPQPAPAPASVQARVPAPVVSNEEER